MFLTTDAKSLTRLKKTHNVTNWGGNKKGHYSWLYNVVYDQAVFTRGCKKGTIKGNEKPLNLEIPKN